MLKSIFLKNIKRPSKAKFGFMKYSKEIKFGPDARASMMKGVEIVTNAVTSTIGPKGRSVVIGKSYSSPTITKDGVRIAQSIILEQRIPNLGAKLLQDIARNTNEKVGDGTTTGMILACSIAKEGFNRINKNINSIQLRTGILKSAELVMKELLKISRDITTPEELTQVATISAKNNTEIGNLIVEAISRVGKTGTITIKDGKAVKDELKLISGMNLDCGYISPYFVNCSEERKCELSNAYILLSRKKISRVQSIIPVLELVHSKRISLVIIAEDVDCDALTILILNKLKLGLRVCAVKASGLGDNWAMILQDIAVMTGGIVIGQEEVLEIEHVEIAHLGRAKEVIVSQHRTMIMGGAGGEEPVRQRIEALEDEIDSSTTSSRMNHELKQRIGNLSDGMAVVLVGGKSVNQIEKRARYSNALHATQAAIAEGVVPGGGIALLRCLGVLDGIELSGDQQVGLEVVRASLRAPCFSIVSNTGINAHPVIEHLLEADDPAIGWDALSGQYVNMFDAGIIDPVKVVRTALINAVGTASLLLTAEVVVVDDGQINTNDKRDKTSDGI